ncbi:MAG: hypothetical protein J6L47_01800 [Alphaproteobacteria bacterium]|nr:hypothetical protein [Alphaproteobacteria bacterium]
MPNLNVGLVSAVLLLGTTDAFAYFSEQGDLCPELDVENIVGGGYTYFDDSCRYDSQVCNDYSVLTYQGGGITDCSDSVVQEDVYTIRWNGDGMYSVDSCYLEVSYTRYYCASGYYGTATGCSSGCTACPSNATCAGGNGSTFVCNTGYYKSGSSCARCPQHSASGNYGSSSSGATSSTRCYISAGTTWTFNDTKGSGSEKFPSTCYYSN